MFAGNKTTLRSMELKFDMAESTVLRVVERVMNFLMDMGPFVIHMPNTEQEKEHFEAEFRKVSGFPGVLGCIDGTSIPIRTPAKNIKSTYCNRHNTPSITLQGICDYKSKFIDVYTGIPGKVHNARVFKMSDISGKLYDICENKYRILGDGAYFIRPWLLTPYNDFGSLTSDQNVFKKFSATRVLIENSFGILKGRFRQLTLLDMLSTIKISKFIICCCILHNLCIDYEDFINEEDIFHEEDVAVTEFQRETEQNLRKREEDKREVIKNSFHYM